MRAPDSNYELQKIWDDPDRLETWTLQQLEALDMEHDGSSTRWTSGAIGV
jgi:hypothetical protein